MRMSPSCGCCYCQKCRIALDDFNRADSTGIGDWVEEAGDWQIDTNELVTSDSDAVAIYDADHPGSLAAHVVSVDLKGEDAGDELLVIIGWVDADNWLGALVTIGDDSTCGKLQLVRTEAGSYYAFSESAVPSLVAGEFHRIKVCYFYDGQAYGGRLAAEVRTHAGVKVRQSMILTTNGLRVGLATGTITTRAHFDNFCWQSHYLGEITSGYGPSLDCPRCMGAGCQFTEDYLLESGTDLGCAWEECSGGDWQVEDSGGGVLALTVASDPAEILHRVRQPFGTNLMRISVDIKMEDVGDAVRVLVARNSCADSIGVGVELEAGATCGVLRFIQAGVQVGDDVALTGFVPNQWHHAEICYGYTINSGNQLAASITPAGRQTLRISDQFTAALLGYASLAAVSVGTKVWFRNFRGDMSYQEFDSPNCPKCDSESWCPWAVYSCDDEDGCRWLAVAGTWDCLSTSDDNALKRFESIHPQQRFWMRVTGTVIASGDAEAIVYIGWLDASHHLALRVTFGGGCGRVQLLEHGSVVREVEDYRITSGTAIDFCVQAARQELSAWYRLPGLGAEEIYLEAFIAGTDLGRKAAVGTGTVTSGAVEFTQLALYVAKSDLMPLCEDCDVCYLWQQELFQDVAIGASLPCSYGGTANVAASTAIDQAAGGTERVAVIPAGGNLSFDIGTDDAEVITYVSFYVDTRPAKLKITACGVVGEATIASNGSTQLQVNGGTAGTTNLSRLASYTAKLCSFNGHDARLVLFPSRTTGNALTLDGATFASAIGSGAPSGSTITVEAINGPIYVNYVVVTRHLKNDTDSSCGECVPSCDVCENNAMPPQVLIEFEDCTIIGLPTTCCDLEGAWYVSMGACSGTLAWSDANGDKQITVTFFNRPTYTEIRVDWSHYTSGFGGTLISSGQWGASLPKPLNCLALNRQPLTTDPGVISSPYTNCGIALAGTKCYISAA